MSTLGSINEKALEIFNFAQKCQRPDGSIYGTAGQCRKGTPVKSEVKEEKKAKATSKKPDDYKKGGKLNTDISQVPGASEKGIYESQIKKAEEYLAKDKDDEFAAYMKQNAEKSLKPILNSQAAVEGIAKEVPEGTEVGFKSNGYLYTEFTTPGGNKVSTSMGMGDFNFQINGSYDAGSITDRKEQMAVSRQVQRVWKATKNNLPEGYVVQATAWGADGRGASRIRAYERMGFSGITSGSAENPGTQYGRIGKGGSVTPSDRAEQGLGSTLLTFTEKENTDVALWYIAIFGGSRK